LTLKHYQLCQKAILEMNKIKSLQILNKNKLDKLEKKFLLFFTVKMEKIF
jgi:hypothetical protein